MRKLYSFTNGKNSGGSKNGIGPISGSGPVVPPSLPSPIRKLIPIQPPVPPPRKFFPAPVPPTTTTSAIVHAQVHHGESPPKNDEFDIIYENLPLQQIQVSNSFENMSNKDHHQPQYQCHNNYSTYSTIHHNFHHHHQSNGSSNRPPSPSTSSTASSTSTSSSNNLNNRHSTSSFDSGRASSESSGSSSNSSGPKLISPSSLGYNSPTVRDGFHIPTTDELGVIRNFDLQEMVRRKGIEPNVLLSLWLQSIHLPQYYENFSNSSYDLPTISRMTPEDLISIGVTKPNHRKQFIPEITALSHMIGDNWLGDGLIVETLDEWLTNLNLQEYLAQLRGQGYTSVRDLVELSWEDLEEIGIRKLGHMKKLMLGIKRVGERLKGKSSSIKGMGSMNRINNPITITNTSAQVHSHNHNPNPIPSTYSAYHYQPEVISIQIKPNYQCPPTNGVIPPVSPVDPIYGSSSTSSFKTKQTNVYGNGIGSNGQLVDDGSLAQAPRRGSSDTHTPFLRNAPNNCSFIVENDGRRQYYTNQGSNTLPRKLDARSGSGSSLNYQTSIESQMSTFQRRRRSISPTQSIDSIQIAPPPITPSPLPVPQLSGIDVNMLGDRRGSEELDSGSWCINDVDSSKSTVTSSSSNSASSIPFANDNYNTVLRQQVKGHHNSNAESDRAQTAPIPNENNVDVLNDISSMLDELTGELDAILLEK